MMQQGLIQLAKDIIAKNIYLTLGTTDGTICWSAPVYYGIDPIYTFYFVSQMNSLHIQHILKNPDVSFTIFDSHQKEGTGNGVQGSGKVYLLPENQLDEAFKWYHTTFIEMKKESFIGNAPYRFFKLIPDHFYVLDPDEPLDVRREVHYR